MSRPTVTLFFEKLQNPVLLYQTDYHHIRSSGMFLIPFCSHKPSFSKTSVRMPQGTALFLAPLPAAVNLWEILWNRALCFPNKLAPESVPTNLIALICLCVLDRTHKRGRGRREAVAGDLLASSLQRRLVLFLLFWLHKAHYGLH